MRSFMPWTIENANLLKTLRQEKGLDVFELSRLACIGQHQLLELENSPQIANRSAFYSEEIKTHIGQRLLAKLQSLPDATA